MPEEDISNNSDEVDKPHYQKDIKSPFQSSSKGLSKPFIAGLLLIIAGIFALIFWTRFFTINLEEIEIAMNNSYIKNLEYNITSQQIKQTYDICGTIGCVTSVFSILGGILAIKRKKWHIALFSAMPQLIISLIFLILAIMVVLIFDQLVIVLFSFIAIILIYTSRQEFEK